MPHAEQQLQEASESVASELEAAKQEASALVSQAHTRANQIIDEAKAQAKVEADRIVQGAQDAIDQEVNQAREALERVSELAVQAEQILKTSVDRMLKPCFKSLRTAVSEASMAEAELAAIARPYARAAFSVALEQDALTDWSGMLALLRGQRRTRVLQRI